MTFWQKFKTGADKRWLHLTAGVMWSGVGIFLTKFAVGWLLPVHWSVQASMTFLGILLAFAIYFLGFSKLAKKNIRRIQDLEHEKPCLFAFQEWKSYPLVALMIALGIFLRLHAPIPKTYLAVMYIGIGASIHYYQHLWGQRTAAVSVVSTGDD
ncbi:MAG: hypothetical protein GXP40_10095 [Chloroflexi bacterium]|nr:hypothetical protein [Chloroflexota bacterium]